LDHVKSLDALMANERVPGHRPQIDGHKREQQCDHGSVRRLRRDDNGSRHEHQGHKVGRERRRPAEPRPGARIAQPQGARAERQQTCGKGQRIPRRHHEPRGRDDRSHDGNASQALQMPMPGDPER
jgi:hypothetical protein